MVGGDSVQCAGSTLGEHRRKRGQEEREKLRQLESDFAHENQRSWDGVVDLPVDHRGPRWPVVGRCQLAPGRCISVHLARRGTSPLRYCVQRMR